MSEVKTSICTLDCGLKSNWLHPHGRKFYAEELFLTSAFNSIQVGFGYQTQIKKTLYLANETAGQIARRSRFV